MASQNSSYKEFSAALDDLQQAQELYAPVQESNQMRGLLAKIAQDEGDLTKADLIINPDTPIEKIGPGYDIQVLSKKNDELESKLDAFLGDLKSLPGNTLEQYLIQVKPEVPEGSEGYEDFVEGLKVYQDLHRGDRESLRKDAVEKYYEKLYKVKEKDTDSDEKKKKDKDKKDLKEWSLSLYTSPKDYQVKFSELNKEKIEAFGKQLEDKDKVVEYVKATLPEDTNQKIGILSQLARIAEEVEKSSKNRKS